MYFIQDNKEIEALDIAKAIELFDIAARTIENAGTDGPGTAERAKALKFSQGLHCLLEAILRAKERDETMRSIQDALKYCSLEQLREVARYTASLSRGECPPG